MDAMSSGGCLTIHWPNIAWMRWYHTMQDQRAAQSRARRLHWSTTRLPAVDNFISDGRPWFSEIIIKRERATLACFNVMIFFTDWSGSIQLTGAERVIRAGHWKIITKITAASATKLPRYSSTDWMDWMDPGDTLFRHLTLPGQYWLSPYQNDITSKSNIDNIIVAGNTINAVYVIIQASSYITPLAISGCRLTLHNRRCYHGGWAAALNVITGDLWFAAPIRATLDGISALKSF